MSVDELVERNGKSTVLDALEEADSPLTNEELSERVDIDTSRVGEILSDLVVENRVSINSNREYRLI